MTMALPRGLAGVTPVARPRFSIFVTVGGLAVFLVMASFILTSYPIINSSLQRYSKEESHVIESPLVSVIDVSGQDRSPLENEDIVIKEHLEEKGSVYQDSTEAAEIDGCKVNSGQIRRDNCTDGSAPSGPGKLAPELKRDPAESTFAGENVATMDGSVSLNGSAHVEIDKLCSPSLNNNSCLELHNGEEAASDAKMLAHGVDTEFRLTNGSVPRDNTKVMDVDKTLPPSFKNDSQKTSSEIHNEESASPHAVTIVPTHSKSKNENGKAESRSCDLYQGKWIYDSAGPLYTNNTCPVMTQMQNCQGNGRPDKDYENYRWKPDQCELPRFSPRKFLELMRGKTLAYVGDSVARNQMESMLCILWQEEAPKNRGNRRMQRWYFRSTSTMIVRIWSSWLVHQDAEPFQFAAQGITKVFLDVPDETFMDLLPTFDVVVLSSGHWFAKQSAYVLDDTIVGGQLWWPKDAGQMKINNVEAFGISVETAMAAIANHPNFTGLAIVRSYSPDHYEGGAWNTGGSCTGKVKPVTEVVRNGFTDAMHEKQTAGFQRAAVKSGNGGSKLRLMDITEVFGQRADGHPGPYRSPDPNKITKRGPHGEPPPQDCLHWCMPGPVDTWNEILLELIRREFERA